MLILLACNPCILQARAIACNIEASFLKVVSSAIVDKVSALLFGFPQSHRYASISERARVSFVKCLDMLKSDRFRCFNGEFLEIHLLFSRA